jgi:hypothetical protein
VREQDHVTQEVLVKLGIIKELQVLLKKMTGIKKALRSEGTA